MDLNEAEATEELLDNEQPEAESESDDGAEDQVQDGEDQPDEESDAEDEQPEKESSDFLAYQDSEGKEIRVSKDEAIQAVKDRKEMLADYTRKTQNLARERDMVTHEVTKHWEFLQQHQADIGTLHALGAAIQQAEATGEGINPQVLRAYRETENRLQQSRQQFQQWNEREKEVAASRVWDHMRTVASDFNSDTLVDMFKGAEPYGFSLEELNGITDKRQVHMWYELWKDAKAYRALQAKAKKPVPVKKPAPTVNTVTAKAGSANKAPQTDAEYLAFLERRSKRK